MEPFVGDSVVPRYLEAAAKKGGVPPLPLHLSGGGLGGVVATDKND